MRDVTYAVFGEDGRRISRAERLDDAKQLALRVNAVTGEKVTLVSHVDDEEIVLFTDEPSDDPVETEPKPKRKRKRPTRAKAAAAA